MPRYLIRSQEASELLASIADYRVRNLVQYVLALVLWRRATPKRRDAALLAPSRPIRVRARCRAAGEPETEIDPAGVQCL
jgi:hypothetical protein